MILGGGGSRKRQDYFLQTPGLFRQSSNEASLFSREATSYNMPSKDAALYNRPTFNLTTKIVLERKGTRPWLGGMTRTSSGLREIDAILGGGQPLGTVLLMEEDRWTQDLALAITRC